MRAIVRLADCNSELHMAPTLLLICDIALVN